MSPTWHIEKLVIVLISGGFFLHLVNASRRLTIDQPRVGDLLLWPVDFVLALLMAICTVGFIAKRREFVRSFQIASAGRQIGYWLITFYVAASLPGHLLFLTLGDTTYFDVFPWWFSLVILPAYVLIIGYFVTLKPRATTC